jgi:hypothetical protein
MKKQKFLLRKFREFTKDSQLTEEDALSLGRQVNKALAKRYRKLK